MEDWICSECRFDKNATADWVIEGPTRVSRHSVISQGHYVGVERPQEVLYDVLDGRKRQLLMDIHSVSEGARPEIDLSKIQGPAHSTDFEPHEARGVNATSQAGNPWSSGKEEKK